VHLRERRQRLVDALEEGREGCLGRQEAEVLERRA